MSQHLNLMEQRLLKFEASKVFDDRIEILFVTKHHTL